MDVLETKSRGGKTFLALLAGVAAGAALGTLLAPDKGTKTRQRIARSAKDITDTLVARGGESLEALRDISMKMVPFKSSAGRSTSSSKRQPSGSGSHRRARSTKSSSSSTTSSGA